MHLGYHELRNMLQKFKEDREKRKLAGAGPGAIAGPNGAPAAPSSRSAGERGSDYRSRGDDYRDRDRDRGYDRDRHSSRYE
jgi:hypothetical protein